MAARDQWKSPHSPGLISLNELLLWTKTGGERPRCLAKRQGTWVGPTAREFYLRARAAAAGLDARPGEHVAILAESSPEWLMADFACLAAGVLDVPVYPTLTAQQVAFILRDCGAVGAFVSSPEQQAKLESVRAELPALRWICRFGSAAWEALLATPAEEDDAGLLATPGAQPATLLYTSGTTGDPKGVLLTHANLCANLNVSTTDFVFTRDERRLSILPLSHITERHLAYVDMLYDAVTYFAESMEQVPANLMEVKPTVLVSVPRLFEKVAAGIEREAAASPLKRRILQWARGVGAAAAPYWLEGRKPPAAVAAQVPLARALVWSKLGRRLGGELSKIISGGAPLGKELAEFLLSMGLIVDEGYGLTETSPVIALNRPTGRRPGSVGRPLPGLEIAFAADGELLVRGPSVFAGYFRRPEETAAALQEGWFHTGDIGRQDAEGFLYITDRKKDLIKTSGGKFIAPQPIEGRLKLSPLIAEAVVVGDGRNYASVLLAPDWNSLAQRGYRCESPADRAAACRDEGVRALFQAELDAVNAHLARFETLKKFALLAEEFSVAGGELTPTIKVRRRTIEQKYRGLIDGLYAEGAPSVRA